MNRAERRKLVSKAATNVLKGRQKALERKQYGFGLVITNRMIAIIFWRWSWTPYDRR